MAAKKTKAQGVARKAQEGQGEAKAAPKRFQYLCPACSDVAIATSNKMIGVSIDCGSCGKLIKLDDKDRYKKI